LIYIRVKLTSIFNWEIITVTDNLSNSYTCFHGHQRIASGTLQAVALVVKQAAKSEAADPVLIFDDSTGHSIDIDTRGSDEEVLARLSQQAPSDGYISSGDSDANVGEIRQRGRPKLGVVPREVTLLPRHWEWLAAQPGGASVALRKLVDEARRTHSDKDRTRKAQERAYRFMSATAGNLPNFEEATRALFANDQSRFSELVATWPADVRDYAIWLAFSDDNSILPQKN
jgi:hypothetical protein